MLKRLDNDKICAKNMPLEYNIVDVIKSQRKSNQCTIKNRVKSEKKHYSLSVIHEP